MKCNKKDLHETIITIDSLKYLLPFREKILIEEVDKDGYYKLVFTGIVCDYFDNDFNIDKRKVIQIFTFNNELVIVLESEK